jgi:hypothetical protein
MTKASIISLSIKKSGGIINKNVTAKFMIYKIGKMMVELGC